jgi:hypothetical protein
LNLSSLSANLQRASWEPRPCGVLQPVWCKAREGVPLSAAEGALDTHEHLVFQITQTDEGLD